MTGYGRCSAQADGREMTVEVKSVNHRFLDTACRFPRKLGFLEESLRNELPSFATRGHVEVFITYANNREDARKVHADLALISAISQIAAGLGKEAGIPNDLHMADYLGFPAVLVVEESEENQAAVRALFLTALRGALSDMVRMRKAEGERLRQDLLAKIGRISELLERIEALAPRVVELYRGKLFQRLSALLSGQIDESRFNTEVALFADRSAIDEELVRLTSHLQQIRAVVEQKEPVGRELDFLIQELNREFNTIASKASDAGISALVVEAKAEIEKLREQVQNIE